MLLKHGPAFDKAAFASRGRAAWGRPIGSPHRQ